MARDNRQRQDRADDHDPGPALGHGRDARARQQRRGLRPGRRLLRRRVPLHRRPAGQVRQVARVRRADLRRRHRRHRGRHGAPTACARWSRSSSPTTSIRPPTRSCRKRRACATARPATSPPPITIRMPCGGGIYGGQTHSQSPEAMFTHVCGLRTVMPSNPYDAKGLLIASIENDDPVIFLEPKRLYNGPFDGHHDQPVVPWSQAPDGRSARGLLHGAARHGGGVPPRRRR